MVTDDGTVASEPAWRERAVSRSLDAARSRAEERIQRFLDAAFELVDEKGSVEFTIQEVIDRSQQSLRSFYQYFDGKDELLLALYEEIARETHEDLVRVVDVESTPLDRLRAFTIRFHQWCDPAQTEQLGRRSRRPIAEFTAQLVPVHSDRVSGAMAPDADLLLRLLDEAKAAGEIAVADTRQAAVLILQMVVFTWYGDRVVRKRVSAEDTWEFCLRGLRG